MANEKSHLKLANHNQTLLVELLPKIDEFPDWVATVAFYKAVHIVEAVFACEKPAWHGQGHAIREEHLKTTVRYDNLFSHYRILKSASVHARYMEGPTTSFIDTYSPKIIIDHLLKHRLHQVETSACKFLRSPDLLVRIGTAWTAKPDSPSVPAPPPK